MPSNNPKSKIGRKKSVKLPDKCFVITPFGIPFDRYYENIYAPAAAECGLEPVRADSLFRSTPIIGDIWQFTLEAKVLIADMSGKNPNVFYELGLAHAVGKPVILVSETVEDIPFDLRALRVLIYDKDNESWGNELSEKIVKALKETMGDLTSAVPIPFINTKANERPEDSSTSIEFRKIWEELRTLRAAQEGDKIQPEPMTQRVRYLPETSQRLPAYTYIKAIREEPPPPYKNRKIIKKIQQELKAKYNTNITQKKLGELIGYIINQTKIRAIKDFRDYSGQSLKDAKEFIDTLSYIVDRMGIT